MLTNILVLGYRRGLIQAIGDAGIPFALWDPTRDRLRGAVGVLKRPLPLSAAAARKTAAEFEKWGPFSHVIAAGESSVFPASHARRVLGCRLSKHSVIQSCSDKFVMKSLLSKQGIPMTPFIAGPAQVDGEQILGEWSQLVLKDTRSSGGRGLHFINKASEVPTQLPAGTLLEKYVEAPECSIESFVHGGEILFTNITEYYKKRHTNIVPAHFPETLTEQLLELNRTVIRALKLDWGMTHLEAYLTPDGPLFGEIALRPPGGYIMELISKAYGFDAWQAFLKVELGDGDDAVRLIKNGQPPLQRHHAVTVLHPGSGRLKSIVGWDRVGSHPSVELAHLKIKPGDSLQQRLGAGEDVGYIFQQAASRAALASVVDEVSTLYKFELGD